MDTFQQITCLLMLFNRNMPAGTLQQISCLLMLFNRNMPAGTLQQKPAC
jgi:hypothetical protein